MVLLSRLLPLALAWVGLRAAQGYGGDVSSVLSSESNRLRKPDSFLISPLLRELLSSLLTSV